MLSYPQDFEAFLDGKTSIKPDPPPPASTSTSNANWNVAAVPYNSYYASGDSTVSLQLSHSSAISDTDEPASSSYGHHFSTISEVDSQVQTIKSWAAQSPRTSPKSNSSSESTLAGALGGQQQPTTGPQAYGGSPNIVAGSPPPTGASAHSSSSLAGALIVPRQNREPYHQQSTPSASSAQSTQYPYFVPGRPSSSGGRNPRVGGQKRKMSLTNPSTGSSSGQHQQQAYTSYGATPAPYAQQQQPWLSVLTSASTQATHPQSVMRSAQPSAYPLQAAMHLQSTTVPNASQQQTFAMATHAAGQVASTSRQPARSGPTPHHSFTAPQPDQNLPPQAMLHRGNTYPQMIQALGQQAPMQFLGRQNLSQHYSQSQLVPQQPYMQPPTQMTYGALTPGASDGASPGYWDGASAEGSGPLSPEVDVDALLQAGYSKGAATINTPPPHQDPQTAIYTPGAGSNSSGENSLPTPVATPHSPLGGDPQEWMGYVEAQESAQQVDERAIAVELISGPPKTNTPRKRANGAAKSSSKPFPFTFTFVGGPSRRAAANPVPEAKSLKRDSPALGDAEDGGQRKKRSRKRAVDNDDHILGRSALTLTPSLASMYEHIHIVNIPCPHHSCTYSADARGMEMAAIYDAQQHSGKKKGKAGVAKPYSCPYISPTTGAQCTTSFRRRGCRDRHGGSHAGKESKDVSDRRLDLGVARRLIWETCRVVEAADWACLYKVDQHGANADEIKRQMESGEISSHQAANSIFVNKAEAKRRIEEEFHVPTLTVEASAVKVALQAQGDLEQIGPPLPQGGRIRIAPVDLSPYPLFVRLAEKRAATYERYFCPERNCDVDFTRLDALLRHAKNSHGEAASKKRKRDRSAALGPGGKRKRAKREEDDDSDEDEEAGWYEDDVESEEDEVVPKRLKTRR